MMFLLQFFLLPYIFAVPEVVITWASQEHETINVELRDQDALLKTCVHSGLQMQYGFEVQICKRRPFWFDICQESREMKRQVEYDPISRNYQIAESWSRAPERNSRDQFSSFGGMRKSLGTVSDLPLQLLSWDDTGFAHSRRSYVSVRVQSSCQGEQDETFVALSQAVTLGQIQMEGFNTGWIDFRLRSDEPTP